MSGEPTPAGDASDPRLSPWPPSREQLRTTPAIIVHLGGATKAAVRIFHPDGKPFVVKDVRFQHPMVRKFWGRRILRREERILRALDDVTGVPRILGRIDRDAIIQEFMKGHPFRGRLAKRHPGEGRYRKACQDLERKVESLHARGVVHLDLRQRRNILVDEKGKVSLIDFESALLLETTGLSGLLLRFLKRMDESACLKYKEKHAPGLLTEDEKRRVKRQGFLSRLWIFHRFGPVLRLLMGRKPTAATPRSKDR